MMPQKRLSLHCLYRFPALYLSIFAVSALTYRQTPPNGISYLVTLLCSLIFIFFQLYSAARVTIVFERREKLYEGERTAKEKLRFLWASPEIRLYLILFLLLPLPFPTFKILFGGFSPIVRYLLSRLFVPLLAAALLLGSMTGLAFHEQNEKKKELRKRINRAPLLYLIHVFKFVPIYAVGSYCLLAFSVVLASLPGIAALFLTTSLGAAVLIVTAVLWVIRWVRGVRIRRQFLEKLENACASQNLSVPEIKSPIASLFRKKERGTVFEITVNDRKYACKLISTFKPNTVHRFYPDGILGHVHVIHLRFLVPGARMMGNGMLYRQRVELYETKYNVGFEAEEGVSKIFIFNPCSKTVEGAYGSETVPLDNGMKIGDYTFYTASGFANALTRNCLHRKANE